MKEIVVEKRSESKWVILYDGYVVSVHGTKEEADTEAEKFRALLVIEDDVDSEIKNLIASMAQKHNVSPDVIRSIIKDWM